MSARMLPLLLALGAALPAFAPATAQTPREAALSNVQLALQICIRESRDTEARIAALAAAGFTHSREDWPDGEVIHHFAAPADTASVMTYGDAGKGFCAVSTPHLGVSEAHGFTSSVLDTLFPGLFSPGDMENSPAVVPGGPQAGNAPCTGWAALLPNRAVEIEIGNAGQDPRCIEDGTAQIMVRM